MTTFQFLIEVSYWMNFLNENKPNAYVGGITLNFKWFSKVE